MVEERKGIALEEFIENVLKDSSGKHDFNVKTSQLKMSPQGMFTTKPMEGSEGFSLEFDDNGFSQVCTKIEVPELYKYAQRLYVQGQTARLSSLFNYHLDEFASTNGDKEWWVRSKDGKCRAFMSDRYGIYDNDFISDILYENFGNRNVDVVGQSFSDSYMNCRIRLLDSYYNAGTKQKDDPLYMGIHITNSEIGLSSISMSLVVYRLVCTNGLIREEKSQILRQKHIGNGIESRDEIAERLTLAFEYAEKNGRGMMEEFSETQHETIEMPMENIQYLSRSRGYSQKFTESVEQNFLEEKNNTRYGLINAFTASARNLNFEQRLDVEKFAGSLIYANLLK